MPIMKTQECADVRRPAVVPVPKDWLGLEAREFKVAVALLSIADSSGCAEVSSRYLSDLVGYQRNTTRQALKGLAAKGVLSVTPQTEDSGGHLANLYQFGPRWSELSFESA